MTIKWKKVNYDELNAKRKERYNFAKVSALLAEYGYICMWLDDDWNGADFVAIDLDNNILKVQLKARFSLQRKYQGKDLYVCFRSNDVWYLYPHDELFEQLSQIDNFTKRISWTRDGNCNWGKLSKKITAELTKYKIGQE